MTNIKPVTLKAIAKQFNMHISTVSRVLNSSDEIAYNAASKETVRKIRQFAKQLGYRPNPHAISLRTNRSKEIAVLVPRLSDYVLATVYEGIEKAAIEQGYITFVSNTYEDTKRQRALAEQAIYRHVDGLIIADIHLRQSPKLLKELTEKNIPFVLVSRHVEDYCAVTCDDLEGGRLAAQHLFSLGHTKILIAAGQLYASTGKDRTKGFTDFYKAQGIQIPKRNIIPGAIDVEAGSLLGEQIFNQPLSKLPTAIFSVNDFMAVGIMAAASRKGIIIGKDISLVGYNDTQVAANLPIPLTTIKSPMYKMGYYAMQTLIQRIRGDVISSITFQPELIVRASTFKI